MCTILVLYQTHCEFPVVVAANRDEFYAREATAAQSLSEEPRIVGGLDRQSGGTWMGATAQGVFAAVTNQRTFRPPDRERRSRGLLVLHALRLNSVSAISEFVAAVDPSSFNAFNLIFGDGSEVYVAYARDEKRVEIEKLQPGIHVLPNDRVNSPDFPKVTRLRASAEELTDLDWSTFVPEARRRMADHWLPPIETVPKPPAGGILTHELVHQLQAVCIHTPAYGTRSSTVLALTPGRVAHCHFADGPPCTADYTDVTRLFR